VGLTFDTFDRLGDRRRIDCTACGRVWEQELVVDDGDRGWKRTLVSGPAVPAGASGAPRRSPVPS
jgi:hypothetical protein